MKSDLCGTSDQTPVECKVNRIQYTIATYSVTSVNSTIYTAISRDVTRTRFDGCALSVGVVRRRSVVSQMKVPEGRNAHNAVRYRVAPATGRPGSGHTPHARCVRLSLRVRRAACDGYHYKLM